MTKEKRMNERNEQQRILRLDVRNILREYYGHHADSDVSVPMSDYITRDELRAVLEAMDNEPPSAGPGGYAFVERALAALDAEKLQTEVERLKRDNLHMELRAVRGEERADAATEKERLRIAGVLRLEANSVFCLTAAKESLRFLAGKLERGEA